MDECCPFCGSELDMSATRCRDCNLSQDPDTTAPLPAHTDVDEVAYEVSDWPVGARLRLTSVLGERGIPWRWEPVLNLVVREDDDSEAEAVLDDIEADEIPRAAAEAATNGHRSLTDDDAEDHDDDWGHEEEDVEDEDEDDWDEHDGRDDDDDWDEDADDNELEDDDEGAVAQAAMADLFVAADRLMHEPDNPELAIDLENAADVIDSSAPPFGIDDSTWSSIRELSGSVRAGLAALYADGDDDGEGDPDSMNEIDADDEIEAIIESGENAVADASDGAAGDDVPATTDTGSADDREPAVAPAADAVAAEEEVSERAQRLRDTLRPWV
jgi:hypothetical protein